MQGFVVVGFAIVAVGLALNKLWDSFFWWLNFHFWDLQLMNLHWTSCGFCSCGCGFFGCDTCLWRILGRIFTLFYWRIFIRVHGRFFTRVFRRVFGRIFTGFLEGFSFSAETSHHWQKLAFYNTQQRMDGRILSRFCHTILFCWSNPLQAGFGNW